jgi:hypothetical protein
MSLDIIVIGSGWYGCHVANMLKQKHHVTLLEKDGDIFSRSSYFNQNRLHLGYHYCRDYKTRNLCQRYYELFNDQYAHCVENIEDNFYLISNRSLIDFETYKSIFVHEQFPFNEIPNAQFSCIQGNVIATREKVINSEKARHYFQQNMDGIDLKLSTTVVDVVQCQSQPGGKIDVVLSDGQTLQGDVVFNCTFHQLNLVPSVQFVYELTISLLFKKIKDVPFGAITVMDGPFFSLYPRDITQNIYTLTDVNHTPLLVQNSDKGFDDFVCTLELEKDIKKMVDNVLLYFPGFSESFQYEGYFLSR